MRSTLRIAVSALCLLLASGSSHSRDLPIHFPLLSWSFHNGKIEATFDCFGRFGPFDFSTNGRPFVVPDGSDISYLFGGAIWIGGIVHGDTLVAMGSDSWFGEQSLYPTGHGNGVIHGTIAPLSETDFPGMRAEFDDTIHANLTYPWDEVSNTPYQPLQVSCALRAHTWNSTPENNIILYDLVITNIGIDTIHAGCVGLYFDCDVKDLRNRYRGAEDDLAGGIRSEGIAYTIDNDGDPRINQFDDSTSLTRAFACKFLATSFDARDTAFNWWITYTRSDSDGYVWDSFGPRERPRPDKPWFDFGAGGTGRPAGMANKYYMMATPEWDYDQVFTKLIGPDDSNWLYPAQDLAADLSDGFDTRFLLSIAPFELPPDSSVRVLFATFTADSVIYRTDLDVFLSLLPQYYDQVIGLQEMSRISKVADSLAQFILDPMLPVQGLRVVRQHGDSLFLQWDAWCFDDIDGYNLYVTPIDPSLLPYPGLPAPWLRPPVGEPFAVLGRQSRYVLTGLNPERMYAINVAHRTARGTGALSAPILVSAQPPLPAPQVKQPYVFSVEGAPASISWQPPPGVTVDHYCLYRFPDTVAAAERFHPFYDLGWAQPEREPRDSFVVDTLTYYYYAMTPYAMVSPSDTTFFEYNPEDGSVYVISAVDDHGYETDFSEPVRLSVIPPRTRDILVVTNSTIADNFVSYDTIRAFYDTVLRGYDYDVVNYFDSSSFFHCQGSAYSCLDWKLLTQYRLVIYDDGLQDWVFNEISESETHGYSRVLKSGTSLAVFGAMVGFTGRSNAARPDWYAVNNHFLEQSFGIDSVYYVGFGYYATYGMPTEDTLLGFLQAIPAADGVPTVNYDTTRYPFDSRLAGFWPVESPPSVALFKTDSGTVTTHHFHSRLEPPPPIEGGTVGLQHDNEAATCYAYGFHLWYMDPQDARALIEWMLPPSGSCCQGLTGNLDGSANDTPDIGDLTVLIDHLFIGMHALPCPAEGNINGDPDDIVGLSDLTALIDYLFLSHAATAPCR